MACVIFLSARTPAQSSVVIRIASEALGSLLFLRFVPLSGEHRFGCSVDTDSALMSLTRRWRRYAQQRIKKNTKMTATQKITETAAQTSCPTTGAEVELSDIAAWRKRCTTGSFLHLKMTWFASTWQANGRSKLSSFSFNSDTEVDAVVFSLISLSQCYPSVQVGKRDNTYQSVYWLCICIKMKYLIISFLPVFLV